MLAKCVSETADVVFVLGPLQLDPNNHVGVAATGVDHTHVGATAQGVC